MTLEPPSPGEPAGPLLPAGMRLDSVAAAAIVSERAHAGQVDKQGEPYAHHPAAVAMLVVLAGGTPHQVMAAYLHDVVEDTPVNRADLDALGLPVPVLLMVDALTRRHTESLDAYLDRVLACPPAGLVKRCDVAHNTTPHRFAELWKRDEATALRLLAKYAHTLARLDPPWQERREMIVKTADFALRAASTHPPVGKEIPTAVALLVRLHGMDGVTTAITTWVDAVSHARRPRPGALFGAYLGRSVGWPERWAVDLVTARVDGDDTAFTARLGGLPDDPETVGMYVEAVVILCARYLAALGVTHG